jgi:hypothetical protein
MTTLPKTLKITSIQSKCLYWTVESVVIISGLSEIILTIGWSKTVESFLKVAANYRKYTVIVAEDGPS